MTVSVTGAAGFIGYHLSKRLLEAGHQVIGIDKINDYYSPDLKFARLTDLGIARVDAELEEISCLSEVYPNFIFYRIDISNAKALGGVFKKHTIDKVCHLAAQAGDQNNDIIPEKPICEQVGIKLIDGLGDKIQSSSWLLKNN